MRIDTGVSGSRWRWTWMAAAGLVLSLSTAGCQLSGDLSCADGVACAQGEACVISPDTERGMCAPTCASSGSCADSAPLCDGQQHVCRACLPGEDEVCSARDPHHPRCGGGRCVECLPPASGPAQAAECASAMRGVLSATPVCDKKASACRACQLHRECDSGVCAKDGTGASYGIPQGSCVPSEQVLVVDANLCTSSGPVFCTVKQAFDRIDAQHRYVLLRKSAAAGDFTDLQLGNLPVHTMHPLQLIGPLADGPPVSGSSPPTVNLGGVAGKTALSITGCKVVIEGLPFQNSKTGIACQGDGTAVRIVRSFFAGNDTALLATAKCGLTVEQTWFGRGPDGSGFQQSPKNARSVDVTASDFWISDSVFADNGDPRQDGFGGVRVHSLNTATRRSGIVNSTFMQQSGLVKAGKYYTTLMCDSNVGDRLVMMNTLLWTDMALNMAPEEHYVDPSCGASLHHNASNDPTLVDDMSVVLPMTATPFASAMARNLHLGANMMGDGGSIYSSGTAEVDIATDRLLAPSVDMDGNPRGGDQKLLSIGAYEPMR